jgi:hypothetical protein
VQLIPPLLALSLCLSSPLYTQEYGVQKALMGSAVYWLLACATVVAGVFALDGVLYSLNGIAGLLREVTIRAWKRLFYPSALHLEQGAQRKRQQLREKQQ